DRTDNTRASHGLIRVASERKAAPAWRRPGPLLLPLRLHRDNHWQDNRPALGLVVEVTVEHPPDSAFHGAGITGSEAVIADGCQNLLLRIRQQRPVIADVDEPTRDNLRAADGLAGLIVEHHHRNDKAFPGKRLAIAQHDRANVADDTAIHEDPATRHAFAEP